MSVSVQGVDVCVSGVDVRVQGVDMSVSVCRGLTCRCLCAGG